MNTPTRFLRALALGSAGVATFYAAAQWTRAGKEPAADEIVRPATPSRSDRTAPVAVASTASAAVLSPLPATGVVRARTSIDREGDAFARLSWLPPPPPPPPPAAVAPPPPPPPPTAPPLPYAFVGMVEKGAGKPQAFLSRGDALIIVAAGDTVDNNTYRIDSLSATQVVFTYLPLNTKQSIDIAGASK